MKVSRLTDGAIAIATKRFFTVPVWAYTIGAMVIAGFLAGAVFLGREAGIDNREKHFAPIVAGLTKQVAECGLKRDEYWGLVERSSEETKRLKAESDRVQAEADRRVANAVKAQKKAETRAATILAAKPKYADPGAAAQELIRDTLSEERQ